MRGVSAALSQGSEIERCKRSGVGDVDTVILADRCSGSPDYLLPYK